MPERQIDLGSGVASVSFTPDGDRIAAGLANGKIAFVASDDWDNVSFVKAGEDAIDGVSFSPDGLWLASSSYSSTIRIWDTRSLDRVAEIVDPSGSRLEYATFSPKSEILCCSANDDAVRLYSTETWQVIAEYRVADSKILKPAHVSIISGLNYSLDGTMIAIGTWTGSILLDAANLTELKCLPSTYCAMREFAFSPDGARVAAIETDVFLWDLKNDRDQRLSHFPQFSGSPSSLCFSGDGQFLAVGLSQAVHQGSTVAVYSIKESRFIASFPCHKEPLRGIAFSPKSNRLVTASVDKTLCEWDWEKLVK